MDVYIYFVVFNYVFDTVGDVTSKIKAMILINCYNSKIEGFKVHQNNFFGDRYLLHDSDGR